MFGTETPAARGLALLAFLDMLEQRSKDGGPNHRPTRGGGERLAATNHTPEAMLRILAPERVAEGAD